MLKLGRYTGNSLFGNAKFFPPSATEKKFPKTVKKLFSKEHGRVVDIANIHYSIDIGSGDFDPSLFGIAAFRIAAFEIAAFGLANG